MPLDFPRAWQVARAAPAGAHHPKCSFAQTGGALLCDLACPVIADNTEFTCPAMHGKDGKVIRDEPPDYGPCPGHPADDGERTIAVRRRDPEEAARLIREGYREHGIPDDLAEAMIEETLKP